MNKCSYTKNVPHHLVRHLIQWLCESYMLNRKVTDILQDNFGDVATNVHDAHYHIVCYFWLSPYGITAPGSKWVIASYEIWPFKSIFYNLHWWTHSMLYRVIIHATCSRLTAIYHQEFNLHQQCNGSLWWKIIYICILYHTSTLILHRLLKCTLTGR